MRSKPPALPNQETGTPVDFCSMKLKEVQHHSGSLIVATFASLLFDILKHKIHTKRLICKIGTGEI